MIEKLKIRLAARILRKHNGCKTYAARELGISLRTIRNWVTKHEALASYRIPKGQK